MFFQRSPFHRITCAALASVCVLAAIAGNFGCSRERGAELRVGMELSYPPFEMTDERGRPAGVSVDLAHALGDWLGQQVKIENIPFDGLIPALKTGKIDLIISSMTATEERRGSIDFSDPYLKTGLCLLVKAGSPVQSIKDADRPGMTVVAKKGTTGHLYAAEHIKNARTLVLDKEASCVLEVVQGKADAFIYDQMSVYKHWKRNPETTRALLTPFQVEYWAVGMRKDTPDLKRRVNEFLEEYKRKKGFEELADRYLKEQKEAFRKLGSPFFF